MVKGLGIERYMGRWYDIASFPCRDQPKKGIDTRSTYTTRQVLMVEGAYKIYGNIAVVNDYWVLYTDYEHALVGQPSRRYLWLCTFLLAYLWTIFI